jgi:crossover junction endodeoxyribonuclease RusA
VSRIVTIDVRGLPKPQGSLIAYHMPNGKPGVRNAPAVIHWRYQVQLAVQSTTEASFDGPVELRLGFELPRPLAHLSTSRKTPGMVKASAPGWPTVAPDLDKLTRAVMDAITYAGLWRDDAQVAVIHTAKRYCNGTPPGVLIHVVELSQPASTVPHPDQLELFQEAT